MVDNLERLSIHLDAAEIMRHGVMFLDQEANVLFVNKHFEQELGYSRGEFQPKTFFQVNPHFNLMAWKKLWDELLVAGQVSIETEHITATGQNIPAKLRGVLLEVAGQKYCQAIVEGDLTESQEDLYLARFCLDNVKEMITWVAPDGRVFYANKAVREVLGFTSKELEGMKIIDLEPGFTEEDWQQEWEEVKRLGSLVRETVRLTKAGALLPVELSLHYMNYNGREYKMVFVRDISKKKARDEFITLSHKALDESSQMIYWLESDGQFTYVNQATCKILGYERAELLSMNVTNIEPGLTTVGWADRWEKLKKERQFEFEVIRRTKAGEDVPVNLCVNYFVFEGKEYNLAFGTDLRNRKKLEEDIKLSFDTINQSPDLVFWLNEEGNFRYFNDTFAKVTGYSRAEIEKMKVLDFFPEHDAKAFKKGWDILRTGKVLSSEYNITCKGGATIPVESHVKLVKYEGKEFSSTVLRDITERKKQEIALRDRLKENEDMRQKLSHENIILKEEILVDQGFNNIISQSPKYKPILRQIGQVAGTSATVLILGETGTGKELLAKAIHSLSDRLDHPMVKINCGALPENLIESELFGHEKGAFTGAFQRKAGRFEMANKGTLFLDEIAELPLELQAKLLRVLQEGEFERLGGTETLKVDVRIIAATNRNLDEMVEKGSFREDLYYRLNVFPIINIPLRERKEDIRPLVRHFIEKYNNKLGRNIEEIPELVMRELEEYEFPGNVRELENLIERAVILSPGKKLVANFQFKTAKTGKKAAFRTMEELQKDHILEALRRTKGKVTGPGGAAELLDMNDKTLYSRMTKFEIGRLDYGD